MKDSALVVRTQAIKNLIQLDAREVRDEIWTDLYSKLNFQNNHGLWIRVHMAKALAQWARPEDQKRFLKLLMDPDRGIQKWAVFGLERSTGLRVSDPSEPILLQKQKWLSKLSSEQI